MLQNVVCLAENALKIAHFLNLQKIDTAPKWVIQRKRCASTSASNVYRVRPGSNAIFLAEIAKKCPKTAILGHFRQLLSVFNHLILTLSGPMCYVDIYICSMIYLFKKFIQKSSKSTHHIEVRYIIYLFWFSLLVVSEIWFLFSIFCPFIKMSLQISPVNLQNRTTRFPVSTRWFKLKC